MTNTKQQQAYPYTRSTKRFRVKENILVYNEQTFADIIDISNSGLSCRYLINLREEVQPITKIDLLNSPERLHVRNITCFQVYFKDEVIFPSFPWTVLRTCGIEFTNLDDSTQKQLTNFIKYACEGQAIP